MGIPSLNYYIRTACPCAIKKIFLDELRNKTIVIDTSIYLYKFKGRGGIIENMYIMCTLFKKNNIRPIFVFDGKPPPEKQNTLLLRKKKKEKAEKEYNQIKSRLEMNITEKEKKKIRDKMKKLEKKFIKVKNKEIKTLKKLFDNYGISYIVSACEADALCAKMVIDGYADACLSDDMDLFVYGCPKVLRYMDMGAGKMLSYNLDTILYSLGLTIEEFRNICVLSGTDYSPTKRSKTFRYYYNLFKKCKNKSQSNNFYLWLDEHQLLTDSVENSEKISKMFDISKLSIPTISSTTLPQPINVKQILENVNFIFPPDTF